VSASLLPWGSSSSVECRVANRQASFRHELKSVRKTLARDWAGALRRETGGARPSHESAGGQAADTATLLLVAAMVVFALGQCLHGAVQAPLVVDLAEPRLLGRYMALSALSWQVGFALGPALGGFMLAVSPSGVWVGAAVLCAVAGALALVVEGTLPNRARRTPLPAPASA
jgi:MFS family permease